MSNSKKILLNLCLLSIISISSHQTEQEKYTFKKTKIKLKPSNYQKTAYEDMTYDDYQEKIEKIITLKAIIREHVLEEKFPNLEPAQCGEAHCKTMMYDMTNHNLIDSRIESMPVLLLIGGIHGTETLGIQTLVQLIVILQKLYRKKSSVFQMLNNVRLLIIPALNMNGFYHDNDNEEVIFGKAPQLVDPNLDFNLNPKKDCFSTFSSQVIHMLYQEYIIYGSLLFSKGNFALKHPDLSLLQGTSEKFQDSEFYKNISIDMRFAYIYQKQSEDEKQLDEIFDEQKEDIYPDIVEFNNSIKNSKNNLGKIHNGTYIDWAFAGSEAPENMKSDCFKANNPFSEQPVKPSEYSNRAIALEIMLDKTAHPSVLKNMGNEMAFIDLSNEEAQAGIIPALIMSVFKFIEMMNPFVSLESMSMTYNEDQEQVLNFDFLLYGVLFANKFELNLPKIKYQKHFINRDSGSGSLFLSIGVEAVIPKEKPLEENEPIDLRFKIENNYDMEKKAFNTSNIVSHHLKYFDDNQYFQNGNKNIKVIPSDFNNFELKRVILKSLDKLLLMEQFTYNSWFWIQVELYFQIGPYFPIKLDYNKETGLLRYFVIDQKVPKIDNSEKLDDYMYESGIINSIPKGASNKYFRELLSSLSSEAKDLRLTFYSDRKTYLCSQFQNDGLKTYKSSQIEQNDEADEENSNLLESRDKDEKNAQNLKLDQQYNICPNFIDQKEEDVVMETNYLDFPIQKQRLLIPSFLISLLNRKAQLSFTPKKDDDKKHLDSGEEGGQIKLNGRFVLNDPIVTDLTDTNNRPIFPDAEQLIKTPHSNLLRLSKNGLSCSSVDPSFVVNSEQIRESAIERFKENKGKNEFFFLYVSQKNNDPDDRVPFYLFTNSKSKTNEYLLYNKNQVFKLKKEQNKDIEYTGKFAGNKLDIFTGHFSKDKLTLTGLYWVLFNPKLKKPVFDCFPGSAFSNLEVKSEFIIFLTIQEEMRDVIHEEFAYELMSTRKKFMIYVFPWVLGIILLLVGTFGILVYFGYMKKFDQWLDKLEKKEKNIALEQNDKEKGVEEIKKKKEEIE